MAEVLLSCTDISKSFDSDSPLFSKISINLHKGETVAICGRSGSGKTTLLHILATLDSPDNGTITPSKNLPYDQLLRNIGFVFQSFHLLEELTVLENILLPVEIARASKNIFRPRAEKLLRDMNLLPLMHAKVSHLSGGEKQRVALARALILDPQFIFADEPTGNLDPETAETIKQLLFKMVVEHAKTLLLVTHDKNFAFQCDKVFELQKSQLLSIK